MGLASMRRSQVTLVSLVPLVRLVRARRRVKYLKTLAPRLGLVRSTGRMCMEWRLPRGMRWGRRTKMMWTRRRVMGRRR
jgi:hypothetical protein